MCRSLCNCDAFLIDKKIISFLLEKKIVSVKSIVYIVHFQCVLISCIVVKIVPTYFVSMTFVT